jgi:hypothetical protein
MFPQTKEWLAWDLIPMFGSKAAKHCLYIMPAILSLRLLVKNGSKSEKEQKTPELEGMLDSVLQCSSRQQK